MKTDQQTTSTNSTGFQETTFVQDFNTTIKFT